MNIVEEAVNKGYIKDDGVDPITKVIFAKDVIEGIEEYRKSLSIFRKLFYCLKNALKDIEDLLTRQG